MARPHNASMTRLRYMLMGREPDYLIAGKARIHPTLFSQYANGKREIPSHHLVALAAVLECNITDLIGEVPFSPIEV